MSKESMDGDPLSAFAAENASPLSTTPHLPVFQAPFRPSMDNANWLDNADSTDDIKAPSPLPLRDSKAGLVEVTESGIRENCEEEDEEKNQGFEPPTKVEKTIMLAAIGVVLLFSVAAGLTTVCDWVL